MRNLKSVGLIGTGYYVPEKVVKNSDLADMTGATDEWITTKIGIKERRICSEDEAASDLSIKAAQAALEDAGVKPEEIGLILVACSNHDMIMPSTACIVANKIGAVNAAGMDIRSGCAGYIFGVVTGAKFVADGTFDKVLVIGAEVHSKMADWSDYRHSVFFSDGAGASVLGVVEEGYGILGSYIMSEGENEGEESLIVPAGGSRLPTSIETIDRKQHFIKMDGKKIWNFATRVSPISVKKALENSNLSLSDIDFFIPHQANINMIRNICESLNIPEEKYHITLDRFGNSAAATLPITLKEALGLGKIKKGDIVGMSAFGAGLSYGALIIKWHK